MGEPHDAAHGWVKVAHEDGAYYEHTGTGETQWDQPEGFVAVHHEGEGNWVEMHDPSSESFYYENTVTGETTWDKPAEYEPHALAVAADAAAAAAPAPAAAAAAAAPAAPAATAAPALSAREKHQLKLLKQEEAKLTEELGKVELAEPCSSIRRECVGAPSAQRRAQTPRPPRPLCVLASASSNLTDARSRPSLLLYRPSPLRFISATESVHEPLNSAAGGDNPWHKDDDGGPDCCTVA